MKMENGLNCKGQSRLVPKGVLFSGLKLKKV